MIFMTRHLLSAAAASISCVTAGLRGFAASSALISVGLAVSGLSYAAGPEDVPTFSFQSVPVGKVAEVMFADAMKVPFILAPDLVQDARVVTLRGPSSSSSSLRAYMVSFFDGLGYTYSIRNGVHYVDKGKPEPRIEVYRPQHRPASYLQAGIRSMFGGSVVGGSSLSVPEGQRPGVTPGTASAVLDTALDVVLIRETGDRLEQVRKLLQQLDVVQRDVQLQALVFEFQRTKGDASALSVAGTILGGKVGISIDTAPVGPSLSLRFGSLQAIASLLDTDSRFRLVSQPTVSVRSGTEATISVGRDVPIVGNVVVSTGGMATRGVDYRSVGTILKVRPEVRGGGSVDLDFTQTLSSAIVTDTGVSESPTMSRRELKSALTLEPGQVIGVGGLIERRTSTIARSLFRFAFNESENADETEYLVFLRASL